MVTGQERKRERRERELVASGVALQPKEEEIEEEGRKKTRHPIKPGKVSC